MQLSFHPIPIPRVLSTMEIVVPHCSLDSENRAELAWFTGVSLVQLVQSSSQVFAALGGLGLWRPVGSSGSKIISNEGANPLSI
jgi:hypothetical protein